MQRMVLKSLAEGQRLIRKSVISELTDRHRKAGGIIQDNVQYSIGPSILAESPKAFQEGESRIAPGRRHAVRSL